MAVRLYIPRVNSSMRDLYRNASHFILQDRDTFQRSGGLIIRSLGERMRGKSRRKSSGITPRAVILKLCIAHTPISDGGAASADASTGSLFTCAAYGDRIRRPRDARGCLLRGGYFDRSPERGSDRAAMPRRRLISCAST